jgi:APA family basic amino acid/polyamine antiporter
MDLQRVMTRKPVAEIVASQEFPIHRLSKVLGPFSIAAMGIGAIIGAGIFVLTGTAAALYAGPAVTISFLLAAIACGLVARATPSWRRSCRSRAAATPIHMQPWASSPRG